MFAASYAVQENERARERSIVQRERVRARERKAGVHGNWSHTEAAPGQLLRGPLLLPGDLPKVGASGQLLGGHAPRLAGPQGHPTSFGPPRVVISLQGQVAPCTALPCDLVLVCTRCRLTCRGGMQGALAQQKAGQANGLVGNDDDERSRTIDILSRLSGVMCALKAHPECRLSAQMTQLENVVDSMWVSARELRHRATLLSPEQMSPAVEAMAGFLRDIDVLPEDGFRMFDVNQDGMISFEDLLRSGETMELDVTEADFRLLFKALGLGEHDNIDRLRR